MACTPSHCTNHGYSKNPPTSLARNHVSVCSGHRQPYSKTVLTVIGGTPVPVTHGTKITDAFLTQLRNEIRNEIDEWNNNATYAVKNQMYKYSSPGLGSGQKILGLHVDERQLAMEQMQLGPSFQTYRAEHANGANPANPLHIPGSSDNDTFPPLPWMMHNKVIGSVITIADINELVNELNNMRLDCICNSDCNCNNVCACHGNCGCNYSDRRLKMEIYYC